MSEHLPKQGYTIEMWNERKSDKHMLTGMTLDELQSYISQFLEQPNWQNYQISCPKEKHHE